jgi:hypothetical protein
MTLVEEPHPFPNAADALEELTHNMCYFFTRATKAVSICPPAYYADLACERARYYLSGVFDPVTPGGSSVTSGTQVNVNAPDVKIQAKVLKLRRKLEGHRWLLQLYVRKEDAELDLIATERSIFEEHGEKLCSRREFYSDWGTHQLS